MVSRRESGEEEGETRRRPATTPEARESQLASLAFDLVERQLRDGTASAQVITTALKLSSEREKLELQRLRSENELLKAKADSMASQKRQEELYAQALNAMRIYSGQEVPEGLDE